MEKIDKKHERGIFTKEDKMLKIDLFNLREQLYEQHFKKPEPKETENRLEEVKTT